MMAEPVPPPVKPSRRSSFRQVVLSSVLGTTAVFLVATVSAPIFAQVVVAPPRARGFGTAAAGYHPPSDPRPLCLMAAAALGLGICASATASLFGRWKVALIVLPLLVVTAGVGLHKPGVARPAAAVVALALFCTYLYLLSLPIDAIAARSSRVRIRNLLWLGFSGWLLYYLGIMGWFWVVYELLHSVGGHLTQLGDPVLAPLPDDSYSIPLRSAVAVARFLAAMAFYHLLCSAYLLNQLALVAEAGRERIPWRRFWWPFARVARR